jgi:hypothetical protein
MPAPDNDESADSGSWSWDPSLYAGSAAYYATGRMAYPPELAAALVTELSLDGTGVPFDHALRALLRTAGAEFTERARPIVLHLWR